MGIMRTDKQSFTRGVSLVLLSLVMVVFVASGCSTVGKGGILGTGIGAKRDKPLSEEELAAEPSIKQFEHMGAAVEGGEFKIIAFGFDTDALGETGLEAVRYNAAVLAGRPGLAAEVEGHTDGRGSSEYNLALGARRARSVRDALVAEGVSGDRLTTVSYGEELPLCKASTEECWARNRRSRLVDVGDTSP